MLVSPISWAHHWVWVLPALVLLLRAGHRIAAGAGYPLFAVAPFWFTPHAAGPREYGFHWLTTLVANCFLLAGVAFLAYMALTQLRPPQRAGTRRRISTPLPGCGPRLKELLQDDPAAAAAVRLVCSCTCTRWMKLPVAEGPLLARVRAR